MAENRLIDEDLRLIFASYPLYSQEHKEDPLVIAHYSCQGFDAFILEAEEIKGGKDYLFFALVNIAEPELGYINLSQLEDVPFIQLDRTWQRKSLKEVRKEYGYA